MTARRSDRAPLARLAHAIAGALAGATVLGACSGAAPEAAVARSAGPPNAARGGESVTPVERCSPTPASPARTETALPYAVRDGDTLRLDLARPAAPGPHPVVVLLHGGGWEGGDRSAMHGAMRLLAARGYAAAAVDYRLTSGRRNLFPAAVDDVRCAVRWLRANAAGRDLDPARVGVLGFSAGAHLASMLGVGASGAAVPNDSPDVGCAVPGGPVTVQAVVSASGPQDLRVDGPYTEEQARLVTNFLGAFPGDAPALAERASPIAQVSGGAAPFLLVHGTRDDLVPIAHARRMRDALRAAGVPATLVELPGLGHAFPALDDPAWPVVGCTTLAFFDRWLGARERRAASPA